MSESKNKQADAPEDRPRCAVGGVIRRGVMCGYVIVGGKFCGWPGGCEHKSVDGSAVQDKERDHG